MEFSDKEKTDFEKIKMGTIEFRTQYVNNITKINTEIESLIEKSVIVFSESMT
jgi:hypothetical protein